MAGESRKIEDVLAAMRPVMEERAAGRTASDTNGQIARPKARRGQNGAGSPSVSSRPSETPPSKPEPAPAEATGSAPDVCPTCLGAGWLRADAPFGHPSFGRIFQCDCLLNKLDSRRTADLFHYSSLDAFVDETFETLDPRVPGLDRAYEVARRYSRDPRDWLILIGSIGCGKTHLAAAIAHEAVKRGNQALFTIVPDLLDHLRATFSPTSELGYDELFEKVRTAGLLVLDDLGTESATPWAREKLFQIINYRYNYRQPTVITTNRRLSDIDDRIRSRMTDASFCTVIEIEGGDYRQKRLGERKRTDGPSSSPRPRTGR